MLHSMMMVTVTGMLSLNSYSVWHRASLVPICYQFYILYLPEYKTTIFFPNLSQKIGGGSLIIVHKVPRIG
jgi:hypothetical protein